MQKAELGWLELSGNVWMGDTFLSDVSLCTTVHISQ